MAHPVDCSALDLVEMDRVILGGAEDLYWYGYEDNAPVGDGSSARVNRNCLCSLIIAAA